MDVTIIGVGAMGCLFAARLAPLARTVMVGRWPAQLAALNEAGLTLMEQDGRQTQVRPSVVATDDMTAVPPADLALVLVKSYQTARAAQQAAHLLKPDGLALTLQNGLGNREALAAVLGPERAAQGVTSQGASIIRPGVARHAGGGPVHLAQTPATAVRLTAVADLFRAAGLETHLGDDVAGLMWGKLAVNAGINPLTGLLDVANGALLERPWARLLMIWAAEEVAAVAAAQGIDAPDAAERVTAVARATATNVSSMRQDMRRGAPTEIDAICGAVVRAGQAHGVATPVNALLLRLVNELSTSGADSNGKNVWIEE